MNGSMSKPHILVVDDEALMRDSLEATLSRKYRVDVARDGRAAIAMLENADYDLILSDLRMPGATGMEVLRAARERLPDAKVVMMTAYGSLENHADCMKEGAFIYVMKPFSPDEIETVLEKALDYRRLAIENRQLRSELVLRRTLIGRSPRMEEVQELIRTVAASRSTALVTGESGTGKELVARAIHDNSPRKEGPFVTINCAALPEELIESELFGHEKGAFTGAIRQTRGRFELADGGTLLLDEISEIGLPLQAKLLRVLQEREFERVGGHETLKVDVRIVATTNRDLQKEVGKGRFREDLFYRLNVIPIRLPPLRDRKDDVPALVAHFLDKYTRENEKAISGVSEKAMKRLMDYHWPGNVRELENYIERAVVICKESRIDEAHLPPDLVTPRSPEDADDGLRVGLTVHDVERMLIFKTLDAHGGNRTVAARVLGISSRTLRNKLNEYRRAGLLPSHFKSAGGEAGS
jgi:DNA-binding NtrC family response regulator